MDLQKFFSFRDQEDNPRPFMDHLGDLRMMIIRIAVTLGIAMVGSFFLRNFLSGIIQHPLMILDPMRANSLQSLGVADSMTISLELALYAGVMISCPVLLFFIAQFLFPALKPSERKILIPIAVFGMMLFWSGILFAYFIVLPETLKFFFQDAQSMHWIPTWTVREYYSFITQFLIAFGVAFEMPVLVLLLERIDLVNSDKLRRARSIAIVVIFSIAAFITPSPDLVTYLMMGCPMVILYELCIWMIKWVESKK